MLWRKSLRKRKYVSSTVHREKNPHISEPVQFKPAFFKGQLYFKTFFFKRREIRKKILISSFKIHVLVHFSLRNYVLDSASQVFVTCQMISITYGFQTAQM